MERRGGGGARRCGDLIDLCRGPHVPDTGRVKAFAVMKNSAAYWQVTGEREGEEGKGGNESKSEREDEREEEREKETRPLSSSVAPAGQGELPQREKKSRNG